MAQEKQETREEEVARVRTKTGRRRLPMQSKLSV